MVPVGLGGCDLDPVRETAPPFHGRQRCVTLGGPMDDPFMIQAHVPDFVAWIERYGKDSAAALGSPEIEWLPSCRYGPNDAQEMLVARPRGASPPGGWPMHVFIHGGYWRRFTPRTYAYLAPAICCLGAVAVLAGYRKMPHHRLHELVADARAAYASALASAPSWGVNMSRVTAGGHSAGAHLAAYLGAAPLDGRPALPAPRRLLLVSGIYDLRPLRESFLQPEIGLTEEEATVWSPLAVRLDPPATATLLVGEAETQPFHDQAKALAIQWGATRLIIDGEDHMSVVHALSVPGTGAHDALAEVIR